MIIRSQDKKRIVNLDNIDSIHANDYGEINAFNGSGNSRTFMGKYSTKEKVINVLDARQNAYMGSTKWTISNDGEMQCSTVPVAFQMPQDSEV